MIKIASAAAWVKFMSAVPVHKNRGLVFVKLYSLRKFGPVPFGTGFFCWF